VESYRLVFADDGIGVARRVEFEAEDIGGALILARRQTKNRSAELWQGDQRLCRLSPPAPEARRSFRAGPAWPCEALA
jgi:hypothetical protein